MPLSPAECVHVWMSPDRAWDTSPHILNILLSRPKSSHNAFLLAVMKAQICLYTRFSPWKTTIIRQPNYRQLSRTLLTRGIVSRWFVCFLISESVRASSSTHPLLLPWFRLQFLSGKTVSESHFLVALPPLPCFHSYQHTAPWWFCAPEMQINHHSQI